MLQPVYILEQLQLFTSDCQGETGMRIAPVQNMRQTGRHWRFYRRIYDILYDMAHMTSYDSYDSYDIQTEQRNNNT